MNNMSKDLSKNDLKADSLYAFGKNKTAAIYLGSYVEKIHHDVKPYDLHMFRFYLVKEKEIAVLSEVMIPHNVFDL